MSRTEQEEKLEAIFAELEAAFKKLDRTRDDGKRATMLRDITTQLREAKTLVKDFEREAKLDGVAPRELAERKRVLVNELNSYIALKKSYAAADDARGELMGGAGGSGSAGAGGSGSSNVAALEQQQQRPRGNPYDGLSMQELMKEGRKGMAETEATLGRAEKLVEDTLQIGATTAATLHDQTAQLNKVVDDLGEIEFTAKKASRVIADITKGLMTDKCIMFLLFLVVAGVIALVVVKVVKPHRAAIAQVAASAGVNTTAIQEQISGGLQAAGGAVAQGLSDGIAKIARGVAGGLHPPGGGDGSGSGGISSSGSGGGAVNGTVMAAVANAVPGARRRLASRMVMLYGSGGGGGAHWLEAAAAARRPVL